MSREFKMYCTIYKMNVVMNMAEIGKRTQLYTVQVISLKLPHSTYKQAWLILLCETKRLAALSLVFIWEGISRESTAFMNEKTLTGSEEGLFSIYL